MTLQEFVDKWLGQKADFDGFYGGQCVDLYRFYVKEVLDFPQSPGVGGAAEIWDTADPEYYDFINNSPTAVPQYGDIVIWNRHVGGGFGHVAIFLSGDVNSFVSLDQNWPTLDKVTKTQHNYMNVIGWLRPKKQPEPIDPKCLELQKEIDAKNVQIGNLQGQVNGLLSDNEKLSKELGSVRSDLEIANQTIKRVQDALQAELNDQHDWADVADKEQEAHAITKSVLQDFIYECEDQLKLSHNSDDTTTKVSAILGSLQKLIESKAIQLSVKDYQLLLVIGGKVIWKK